MQSIPTCSRWKTAHAILRHAERCTPSVRRSYAQAAAQSARPHDTLSTSSSARASTSKPPPFVPPKPTTQVLVERTRHGGERLIKQPYVFPRKTEPIPLPRPLDAPPPHKLHQQTTSLLSRRAKIWVRQKPVHIRLRSFGIPTPQIPVLLNSFAEAANMGAALNTDVYDEELQLELWEDLSKATSPENIDRAVSRVFFAWLRHPSTASVLPSHFASTLQAMEQLVEAADYSHPHEEYQKARSIHRKIIMHVGPTNSGKTHNALRALAAAPRGVYAGPLRLLAHEIWERLNRGQIVPLGIDPTEEMDSEPDTESAMDIAASGAEGAAVRKTGSSRWARPCNMITGEEHRVVADNAGLISCTVEMTNVDRQVDVAVIDEIQLIADPFRGGAWTKAVLGVPATELHLCGEETAVPIIEQLVKETGDELIVHRYQRLSPLKLSPTSLKGNLKNIQKGDCVVTFSRSSIFDLKKRIEAETGMRCAVAYGALPPELRSEQAALFNDPNSGYDVLVGSDALGMGLNLKIRRMILSATTKWNGRNEEPLSVSMIKQIAGRAGRYGLHDNDKGAGVAMTMNDEDMPILEAALAAPMTPLRYARLIDSPEVLAQIISVLPPDAGAATAIEVFDYVTMARSPYKVIDNKNKLPVAQLVDAQGIGLSFKERLHLLNAPVNLRDPRVADGMANFIKTYRASMSVEVRGVLRSSGMLTLLKEVLHRRQNQQSPPPDVLPQLESLHKLVSAYIWLSFRNQISWPDMEEAQTIRSDTETAMNYCLESMDLEQKAKSRYGARVSRRKGMDAGTARIVETGDHTPRDLGFAWKGQQRRTAS